MEDLGACADWLHQAAIARAIIVAAFSRLDQGKDDYRQRASERDHCAEGQWTGSSESEVGHNVVYSVNSS